MNKIKLMLLLMLLTTAAAAQKSRKKLPVHFDAEKWVEYVEGDMPLVISVPHGGRVTVDSLPIRDCKGAITGVDGRTIELARDIQHYFKKTYNLVPHIIISHIARKHVDQNRELDNKATCGYEKNEKPWHTFHNWVDSALNLASSNGKRAMYIDLHGHGHKNQRLEIGYNLGKSELEKILDETYKHGSKYHSITNLLKQERGLNLKEAIFGEKAFGTFLVNNGVPATPSSQDLVPTKEELFFSGGDNTRRFTSEKYPNVFGLQIECDSSARSEAKRSNTAKGIAEAIVQYLNIYANTQIEAAKK
ncbi:hypothetical protein [Pedobacter sp. UBA4863]|uniref:hypothetical protein n=1 Tax=Pedobacter sp. UBA4863 TaxID=1947060 RepID=UPI0025CF5158|nr:hypothetical protein [Pedobacter sp. UBA4863]